MKILLSTRMLIDYVDAQNMARMLYPVDLPFAYNPALTDWLPDALGDNVYLHSMLSASAAHLSKLREDSEAPRLEAYLGTAYRLLRSRLNEATPSNATIGAVTCLVGVEVCPT